jgi:transcription antitermination factor NusB
MSEDDFFGDGSSADEAPPDNRHGARQVALQALYWEQSAADDAQGALDELCGRFALSEEVRAFAGELLQQSAAHAGELDELAAAMIEHWSWERIARIDRLILRLALAEMLFIEEIPVRVSIDEAVELARSYSTDKSYAFVNGVLDGVVRQKGLVV